MIEIIAVLIAMLLPALNQARAQSNARSIRADKRLCKIDRCPLGRQLTLDINAALRTLTRRPACATLILERYMATLVDKPLVKHIKPVSDELLVGDLIQPRHPLFGVVWINANRMSGVPCFYGTRVPLKNLFDYIEGGNGLDDFLEGFPGVTREQAIAVIDLAQSELLATLPQR